MRRVHALALNPLFSVDAFVPGNFSDEGDMRGEEPFFSHQNHYAPTRFHYADALSSTRVGPVEFIDETVFVELSNKAGINQIFYFEGSDLRIL